MSNELPQWQREILNFKGIKSLFVLQKNVSDIYPFQGEAPDDVSFLDCNELLGALFGEYRGTAAFQMVYYDPIERFKNPYQDPQLEKYLSAADKEAAQMRLEGERINSFGNASRSNQGAESALIHDSMVIRALLTRSLHIDEQGPSGQAAGTGAVQGTGQAASAQLAGQGAEASAAPRPIAVVVNMASRILSSPSALDADEIAAFTNMQTAARDAVRIDGNNRNALILVVNNLRDLPEWFISANPDLRSIVVPSPDREARELYVDSAFGLSTELSALDGKSPAERLIDKTDGMSLRELDELRRMYLRQGLSEDEVSSLVDVYKYGLKENKWESITEKLERDPAEIIRRRVKGQDQAVSAVVSVLKRSAMGLSGATHSSSSKPKGILFLSGPTGTGKTEIVKAVTELLFGDERSLLRFDMSEYQADNADQKLFGAPPGYVGYAEGGQLTNAVRANPFSVVLFDEVEKASSSIMDKFLQILEDGRMTDGQGNTVYFSETIIFFTSNIGFSREVYDPSGRHVVDHVMLIEPGEPYEVIREKVMDAMRANFKPEFLGRIGNNVVVFDYIDDESAAAILKSCVERVNRAVEQQHGITLAVEPVLFEGLTQRALADNVKEKGGRGIGNLVETDYLNALSDYLFDNRVARGETVTATLRDGAVRFERSGGEQQ